MTSITNKLATESIASRLGERLKRKRLNLDITQDELGQRSNTSRNIVKNAEKGKVSLINLVAILKGMEQLDQLDAFLFEPDISPIQMMKLQGKVRKRAGGARQSSTQQKSGLSVNKSHNKDSW